MNTKCYCGHTATCDCEPQKILEDNIKQFENCIKSLDESFAKQETLEEAAQKRFPINHNLSILERMGLNSAANMGFIEGAKWQEQRMYSEITDDCINDWLDYRINNSSNISFVKWFEQFKKK